MARNPNRTSESEIALATLRVAAGQQNSIASYDTLRKEIPNYINLSDDDHQQSQTRQNEEVWEQKIRNIKSHYDVPGNILCEGYAEHISRTGYKITTAGRAYLTRKGY